MVMVREKDEEMDADQIAKNCLPTWNMHVRSSGSILARRAVLCTTILDTDARITTRRKPRISGRQYRNHFINVFPCLALRVQEISRRVPMDLCCPRLTLSIV